MVAQGTILHGAVYGACIGLLPGFSTFALACVARAMSSGSRGIRRSLAMEAKNRSACAFTVRGSDVAALNRRVAAPWKYWI